MPATRELVLRALAPAALALLLGFELWTLGDSDAVYSDGFESSGAAVWSAVQP